jgi:hypothetical protein
MQIKERKILLSLRLKYWNPEHLRLIDPEYLQEEGILDKHTNILEEANKGSIILYL